MRCWCKGRCNRGQRKARERAERQTSFCWLHTDRNGKDGEAREVPRPHTEEGTCSQGQARVSLHVRPRCLTRFLLVLALNSSKSQ